MIQGQIFNFDSNKLEASHYRMNLRGLTEDSSGKTAESFLLSRRFNFKKLDFSFRKKRNLTDAQLIDSNLRNLNYFLYYANKNLNSIDKVKNSFELKTRKYFKVLNKDLIKLNSLVKEVDLKLNSKFNKVKIYNIFQEKEVEESYDLIDEKRNRRFLKREQASFKDGQIETRKINESILDIISIEILQEESFYGDDLVPLEISKDTSLIYRNDKFFYYIVGTKQNLNDLQVLPHKNVELSFVINFDGFEEINNIDIEFGSSLPILLAKDQLEYFDGTQWLPIDPETTSLKYTQSSCSIILQTVRTNKLKIKLIQKKFHDTALMNDETENALRFKKLFNESYLKYSAEEKEKVIKRIYDFSIMHLECKRKANHSIGYYREAHPVTLNKPLSLQMKTNLSFVSNNCFIEKYAHVVLYGEKDFLAFKRKATNHQHTKRVNKRIPLPSGLKKEKELLVFRDGVAKATFFPELIKNLNKKLKDIIKIYKVDPYNLQPNVELTIGEDYEVSFDGGSTYIDSDLSTIGSINNLSYNSEIYNFVIKLSQIKRRYIYVVEYSIADEIKCGYQEELLIKAGELIFNKNLQESVGFVRPVLVIRNKSAFNQCSKIEDYKILIEELDLEESSYIEYEVFSEIERQGSSNVI